MRILQENLPDLPHARRFQWLYRDNPDGPAWSWFACDGEKGHAIGATSVFPRAVWIDGQPGLCGQVGDFGVAAGYRSLGPAVMMQRATFGPVDEGKLSFCYDCPPHAAGMSTFRRLGMSSTCEVIRYSIPLRVNRYLRRRFGPAGSLLSPAGNLFCVLSRSLKSRRHDFEIQEHMGPFGEEFTRLDTAVNGGSLLRSRRTAAHLNWRYRADPLRQYRVLTARRGNELRCFLVLSEHAEVATVIDLFGAEFPVAARALLGAAIEFCASRCYAVEAFTSKGSHLSGALAEAGFHARSVAAQVVTYSKRGSETARRFHDGPRWMMTAADIQA